MMRSRIRLLDWSLLVLLPCLMAAGLCLDVDIGLTTLEDPSSTPLLYKP